MARIPVPGLAAAAVLLALAAALASCQGTEEDTPQVATETASPTPLTTPIVEGELWRWVNVTIVIPKDSDFSVNQTSDPPQARPPRGGVVLVVMKGTTESSSYVVIDAESGEVLRNYSRDEDRGEIQGVLDTLTVSPLRADVGPWPYSGELPTSLPRESFGGLSFVRPAPDSGISVHTQTNDPGGPGLLVTNGRSGVGVYVDQTTGKLAINTERLLPEYEAAFNRWVATVKLCGAEVSC